MGEGIQEWLSKNCGRQPLKKIQLGPFLNTLTQVLPTINCYSTKSSKMEDWRFSKDFRSKYNNMNDNLNNNLMSENIRQKKKNNSCEHFKVHICHHYHPTNICIEIFIELLVFLVWYFPTSRCYFLDYSSWELDHFLCQSSFHVRNV